jgi:uncharacterized membrane protein YcfT
MGAETEIETDQAPQPKVPKERLAWPDLARGACMVLVVLLHTDHALRHIGESDELLHLTNAVLVPLRQPLFFMISGMLGAGILSRGPRGVLVHRVGRYVWLYIFWWLLARGIHIRLDPYGPFGMEDFFVTPASLGELFRMSHDDHWFFYALAVFFALALVLSRLPDAVHALIAVLIAVPGLLELGTATGNTALDWSWYYPFFAFGARRSGLLWAMAPRLGRWPVLITLGLLWAVATRFAVRVDPLFGNAVTAGLALVAVPAGLAISVRLAAFGGPMARGLIVIGRNTLPIYVLHPLVLRMLFLTFQRSLWVPKAGWVVLSALVAVGVSYLLGRALRRVPGLFDLPPLPTFLASAQRSASLTRDSV